MREPVLTPRLRAIAQQVRPCNSAADVGCDHAQVSICLIRQGIARHVYACDVNAGPLARARRAVERAGLGGRIECIQSDGLDQVPVQDAVVIAGMGGDLIADILERAPWTRSTPCQLVLQPMTAAPRLRGYLYQGGYGIIKETYVKERDKLYVVLTAEPGRTAAWGTEDLYASPAGAEDPLYGTYLRHVIGILKKKQSGLAASKCGDAGEIEALERLITGLETRRTVWLGR